MYTHYNTTTEASSYTDYKLVLCTILYMLFHCCRKLLCLISDIHTKNNIIWGF